MNFLKQLNLVDCRLNRPPVDDTEWNKCYTRLDTGYCYIWYKFNKQTCKNFKDVIVLCGDYIGHDLSGGECSRGTEKILTQLNGLLNNNGRAKDGNKKLFLVVGNHDIFFMMVKEEYLNK